MGAMLIRHMAWRIREKVGTALPTATVIAQTLLHEANYQASAGGQRDDAQAGHRRRLEVAYAELQRQALPMESPEQIEAMAIAALLPATSRSGATWRRCWRSSAPTA